MTIWRTGYRAAVKDPATVTIINGVTEGTVTGTTQRDGYYDVHLVDDHGVPATYSNRDLARPADYVWRPSTAD